MGWRELAGVRASGMQTDLGGIAAAVRDGGADVGVVGERRVDGCRGEGGFRISTAKSAGEPVKTSTRKKPTVCNNTHSTHTVLTPPQKPNTICKRTRREIKPTNQTTHQPNNQQGRIRRRLRPPGRIRQHRGRPSVRHHLRDPPRLGQRARGPEGGAQHDRPAGAAPSRGGILSLRAVDEAGVHPRSGSVRVYTARGGGYGGRWRAEGGGGRRRWGWGWGARRRRAGVRADEVKHPNPEKRKCEHRCCMLLCERCFFVGLLFFAHGCVVLRCVFRLLALRTLFLSKPSHGCYQGGAFRGILVCGRAARDGLFCCSFF